jgi:hypothetical protein
MELLVDVGVEPDGADPRDVSGCGAESDPVENMRNRSVVRAGRNQ